MKYDLVFVGAFDAHFPVDYFIQHISNLQHFTLTGNITLISLTEKLREGYKDDQTKLDAVEEFYKLQIENDTQDDHILVSGDTEEVTVFHFDLRTVKE